MDGVRGDVEKAVFLTFRQEFKESRVTLACNTSTWTNANGPVGRQVGLRCTVRLTVQYAESGSRHNGCSGCGACGDLGPSLRLHGLGRNSQAVNRH